MFANTATLPTLSLREASLSAAFALAAATVYTGLQYIAPTAFELASRIAAVAPQAIASGIKPFALAAWAPASYSLPLLAVAFASRKAVALLDLGNRLELSEQADSYVQLAVSNAAMCVATYAFAVPTLALAIAAVVWNVRTYQLTPATQKIENSKNNNNTSTPILTETPKESGIPQEPTQSIEQDPMESNE